MKRVNIYLLDVLSCSKKIYILKFKRSRVLTKAAWVKIKFVYQLGINVAFTSKLCLNVMQMNRDKKAGVQRRRTKIRELS